MIAFIAIAALFTLSWVGAIWLYGRTNELYKKFENSWGPGFFLYFIGMFVLQILLLRTMSGVMETPKAPAADPGPQAGPILFDGLTPGQVLFIGVLAMLTFWAFARQLHVTIRYLFKHDANLGMLLGTLGVGALLVLMTLKMIHNPIWVGNILVFLILLLGLNFAVALKKSSFVLIFAAIMALDVYLVWHTGMSKPAAAGMVATAHQAAGDGWYLRMFQSKMVQHFPFPVGFRWGGHLLGGGDVFFTCTMVMYACRVWSRKAAITVGILATLPLLLLPFLPLIFKMTPVAWPYTIFIAPWALVIAFFAPKKLEAPQIFTPEKSQ